MPIAMERRFGRSAQRGRRSKRSPAIRSSALPEPFAAHLRDVVLTVEEFADDETLAMMGIDDPFDLTGLYHGLPLGPEKRRFVWHAPDRIFLYRRPILDEWAADGETLEHLVHHILVHEVGHHFGLSDDDMHRARGRSVSALLQLSSGRPASVAAGCCSKVSTLSLEAGRGGCT